MANRPERYDIETNAAGETLIRALLSDAAKVWMRKMGAHPITVPPQ